jgi:hypothetical protein
MAVSEFIGSQYERLDDISYPRPCEPGQKGVDVGVPPDNNGFGRLVYQLACHRLAIIFPQYLDRRLSGQGVGEPRLAFRPVPGPFNGLFLEYLPCGLRVLAVKIFDVVYSQARVTSGAFLISPVNVAFKLATPRKAFACGPK